MKRLGKICSMIVTSVLAIAMTSCEFSDSDKNNNKNTETKSAESQVTRKNLLEDIKNELNEGVSESKDADGISDSEDYSETEAVTEIEAPVTEKALEIIKDELAENKETIPGVTKAVVLPGNIGMADYQHEYDKRMDSYRIIAGPFQDSIEINVLCCRDVLNSDIDSQNKRYLVEYDGLIGYMYSSDFEIVNEKSEEELSDEMLVAIAQLKYLQAWFISQPCIKYSNFIKCDDNKKIGEGDQKFFFCPDIHSSNDLLNKCYTFFSRKYSDMYDIKFMHVFENYFTEYDDEYYYQHPIIGGDIRMNCLTPTGINFVVLSRKDNEVFFTGSISNEHCVEKIDTFSLVYEDGTWKCGIYFEL